jgi:hypothetical protein
MHARRIGQTPVYVRPLLPERLVRRRIWLVRPAFPGATRVPRWARWRVRTYKTAAHLR